MALNNCSLSNYSIKSFALCICPRVPWYEWLNRGDLERWVLLPGTIEWENRGDRTYPTLETCWRTLVPIFISAEEFAPSTAVVVGQ